MRISFTHRSVEPNALDSSSPVVVLSANCRNEEIVLCGYACPLNGRYPLRYTLANGLSVSQGTNSKHTCLHIGCLRRWSTHITLEVERKLEELYDREPSAGDTDSALVVCTI